MYSIITVIYGIPLTQELEERNSDLIDADPEESDPTIHEDMEEYGFEIMYTGSGNHTPGYCGVELSEFDECSDSYLPISEVAMVPTDEQKAEAHAKIEALDDRFKDLLPAVSVYFIFSTS